MKSPEKTHLLIHLLQAYEGAVISALAATPDVIQRAEALTRHSFSDDSITPEQEEAICVSREEVATDIFTSLLGYLPQDLPPGLSAQAAQPPVPGAIDRHAGTLPPTDLPTDPAAPFKDHADDNPTDLIGFYNCVEEVTHPGFIDPNFNPHQAYIWAPPPTIPPQDDDDAINPCAIIYDKDGTIVQIGHQGACACLSNDGAGICLESLPAIIECTLAGAVYSDVGAATTEGPTPEELDARDKALKYLYTIGAYRDLTKAPLIDEYISDSEHTDGYGYWLSTFGARVHHRGLADDIGIIDTEALYKDLQSYLTCCP